MSDIWSLPKFRSYTFTHSNFKKVDAGEVLLVSLDCFYALLKDCTNLDLHNLHNYLSGTLK